MVLFVNVNIGQRVEVKWKNRIVPGTVKYKGGVNRVAGDWVGVALDASGMTVFLTFVQLRQWI